MQMQCGRSIHKQYWWKFVKKNQLAQPRKYKMIPLGKLVMNWLNSTKKKNKNITYNVVIIMVSSLFIIYSF